MFDAFTKVVAQADARGEFINAGQIDALAAVVAESNKRMDSVNRITSNASSIVTSAARELFAQQSALIAPGGNAYTHRRMAACLREMDIILRYVTSAVFNPDVANAACVVALEIQASAMKARSPRVNSRRNGGRQVVSAVAHSRTATAMKA